MAAIERALAPLARFNDAACALGKYAGLSPIAMMTAVILLQVFFRYVLGSALTWSEEVARFMMVWMTFLVAPIAYRGGANVALDILVAQLGGRLLALLRIVINLLVIGFVLTFFVESFVLIGAASPRSTFCPRSCSPAFPARRSPIPPRSARCSPRWRRTATAAASPRR